MTLKRTNVINTISPPSSKVDYVGNTIRRRLKNKTVFFRVRFISATAVAEGFDRGSLFRARYHGYVYLYNIYCTYTLHVLCQGHRLCQMRLRRRRVDV